MALRVLNWHMVEPMKGSFGEVCFAYGKPKQGYMADPKWRLGIYLGKTELQDNWVIGDVNKVYLSRSLRCATRGSRPTVGSTSRTLEAG